MDFAVIDVETANEDFSSICQVGIASFSGDSVEGWKSLVDPHDYFSPLNVSIHGIDGCAVAGAPTWAEIFPEICQRLSVPIVVTHTPFDRTALLQASGRFDLPCLECNWLDTAKVVRRAWPQFAKSGYGLSNVARCFQMDYQAHDALEDARCAGLILLKAIAETGIGLQEWLVRSVRPIGPLHSGRDEPNSPNPEGDLFGEVLVFTGALTVPRREAVAAAMEAGCRVDDGITTHTTILVAGEQDIKKLNGHEKSSKLQKAEALVIKGQKIRIIGESDFVQLASHGKQEYVRYQQ